jgi:prepilin-type N-terminal cleavage/methylation domain-containing protein
MRTSFKKNGFSLTEMIVVIAIIALLTALGLPAIHSLQKSFESGSGVNSIIDAALSSARAIAAREQRYAGIRFELDFHNNQYMIFIIHDPEKTKLSSGFCELEGQKPIKLPDDVRIIDLIHRGTLSSESIVEQQFGVLQPSAYFEKNPAVDPDGQNNDTIRDMSCFSVIFSPTGKLAIHEVRVRNRDGVYKPDNSVSGKVSMDDIFNSPENILNFRIGMFLQDDDWSVYNSTSGSLGTEFSREKFYIYEKSYFDRLVNPEDKFNYLKNLKPVFINPYTGTIINSSK